MMQRSGLHAAQYASTLDEDSMTNEAIWAEISRLMYLALHCGLHRAAINQTDDVDICAICMHRHFFGANIHTQCLQTLSASLLDAEIFDRDGVY